MPRIRLRPTTAADLCHVIGEPLPYRIQAVTGLLGERVIGIGGIAFPPGGPVIAFAQLLPAPLPDADAAEHAVPEARRYPVSLHRAGLAVRQMIRESGMREVIATADASSAAALRWLKRLDFVPAANQPIEGRIVFVLGPPRLS